MKIREHILDIKDWKTIAPMVIGAIVFIVWGGFVIFKSSLEKDTEVIVDEGAGVYKIADVLEQEGVIDNKFVFVIYTLATGNEKKLQAGRYIFKPGTIIPSIVYSMARGLAESDDIEVTIPEGMNIWEIDKALSNTTLIKEGEFFKNARNLEGKLFPDTYRFKNGTGASGIVARMTDNYSGKVPHLTYGQLIVASILEKEAKTENDMRLVAGIINKRMELGMPLQIDATVAYGACLRSIGYCDVTQIGIANEIKIDGLYNSYARAGLPPGPISNPGLKAIRAALDPIRSDYLYYLSTRDGGQVIFSKTATEHTANRRKYLGI
ncbi:MAG: endolytic transglycosylase MltG [Candidatus Colwellbacteria bacterium]|nr:endolytic transglycosylase MltG [Candidatus Colwellbacteria bacterium]